MKQILVCGSIAYDYVLNYDGLFSDNILPDKLQDLSVCFLTKQKTVNFGGCGGNIAYSLSLLHESPILLGVMGKDYEPYEKWLQQNKVSTEQVAKITNEDTACAFIASDKDGHQITFFYPGASRNTPRFDLSALKDRVSFAIIAPDNDVRMGKLAEECRLQGIPYFFDPGQQLPVFSKSVLLDILETSAGVFLNEYEWEMLLRKVNLTAEQLLSRVRNVIITLGEKGSVICTPQDRLEIAIFKPTKIVDPTGCGDSYRAGFLKGLKESFDLRKCGQMGALLATYNIEHLGTQNHQFSLEEYGKRLNSL